MRARARVEYNIRRLKDSGAQRSLFTAIDADRAWVAVVCFGDGLVRWFQRDGGSARTPARRRRAEAEEGVLQRARPQVGPCQAGAGGSVLEPVAG